MGDRHQQSRPPPTDHLPGGRDTGIDAQPIQGIGSQSVGSVETEVKRERHAQRQRQSTSSRILEELIPKAVFELNNDHAGLAIRQACRWARAYKPHTTACQTDCVGLLVARPLPGCRSIRQHRRTGRIRKRWFLPPAGPSFGPPCMAAACVSTGKPAVGV